MLHMVSLKHSKPIDIGNASHPGYTSRLIPVDSIIETTLNSLIIKQNGN